MFIIYKIAGGVALGSAAMFAQVDFSRTITLGSVLLGIVVVITAGYFAIRNQQVEAAVGAAATWKTEAEAREARAVRLEAELREKIGEYGTLEAKLAGVTAALEVEKAKHDLRTLIQQVRGLHSESLHAMKEIKEGRRVLVHGAERNLALLTEIRDLLRGGNASDGDQGLTTGRER